MTFNAHDFQIKTSIIIAFLINTIIAPSIMKWMIRKFVLYEFF